MGHPLVGGAAVTRSREAYAEEYRLDPAEDLDCAACRGADGKRSTLILPALHELAMSDLISSSAAYTTFDGDTTRQPNDPAAHTRYEFLLPVASTIDAAALQKYIEELNAEHLKYFGPEASTLRLTLVPDAAEALFHARGSVVCERNSDTIGGDRGQSVRGGLSGFGVDIRAGKESWWNTQKSSTQNRTSTEIYRCRW